MTPTASPVRIGSMLLQPVSDGVLRVDPSSLFADAQPDDWQSRVERDANGRVALALTCLLVQVGDRRILIDTGFGDGRPDNLAVGHLAESLAGVGVSAADIDVVVVSHPHGDHIGGATTGRGEHVRVAYPGARYWLGQADWDEYSPPEMAAQRGLVDKLLPLARADVLDLADGEQEIAPGVRLLPLPGHTPGHMGVAFTDGQQMAVYVGDMVHHPLQVEHPDWSPTFDALPPLSRQTRRALLERARREHALILSYHLPWPGIGHVGAQGWQPAA